MREPNHDDARLALRLYGLRREKEMRKARSLVTSLVGAPWSRIEELLGWEHPSNPHFRQATSYWEMCASFVNRGILHPDVYLDCCGEGLFTYAILLPHVPTVREKFGPRFQMQTERAVAAHPQLKERVDLLTAFFAARIAEEQAKRERDARAAKKNGKPRKSKAGKTRKRKHATT